MIGAALVATLAVALWMHPPRAASLRRLEGVVASAGRRGLPLVAAAATVVAGTALLAGRWLAWWAAVAILATTIAWVVEKRRRRRAASRAAEQIAHGARLLASLLRAGQIPSAALSEAARDCPALEHAAGVSALGGDTGDALAEAATQPGRGQLALVAAAWKLSERSGAPMADSLARVAESLRHRRALSALIDAELAAARTSGHIMAGLPFAAVALGAAVGADPLSFLFAGAAGPVLVLVAVGLTAVGVLWTERLAEGAQP
ncbi:MAG TPA: hypothetical protein PKE40_09925 [Arachnia sp.]|nr:hypothetical protein [Arachnia sp.]HMT86658.1 hypothetical protein [Arachnia sp.]